MLLRPMFNLGLIASALLALSACGNKEEMPKPTEPTQAAVVNPAPTELIVKIGHAAPLTGPQAHLGKDNENGVRLAVDELNSQAITIDGKKIKFELLSEDDQADPKVGTTVAQKFVDAKVNGVVGHLNSGTTIPASKIYSDAGIPQISPSATNVNYTAQGFKTAFRVMANDAQQGKVLGEYAVNKMGAKKIAIIDDRTAYGQGLADEFEKAAKAAGATIIKREFTSDKATDFMAILTSVKASKPDLLFYGGMDAQAAPMVKQMQTLGLKTKFLAGDGASTAEFLKLSGNAGEGIVTSLPGVPLDKMPQGTVFTEKFKAKYGQIQLYAPYCYDAMMVMAAAMQKANSVEPAKYLPELAKINHAGVTAQITFDEKGDIKNGAITLYQAKNGKWEPLETVGGADTAAPQPAVVAAAVPK